VSTTFDTLKYATALKAAGVPPEQAEASARALAEALNISDLVTREYLDHRLEAVAFKLKWEILVWIIGLLLGQTALLTTIIALLLRIK